VAVRDLPNLLACLLATMLFPANGHTAVTNPGLRTLSAAEMSCHDIHASDVTDRVWRFAQRWVISIANSVQYEPSFELCSSNDVRTVAVFQPPARLIFQRSEFEQLLNAPRSNWNAIAALSHEVGHFVLHINLSATRARYTQRDIELQADEFAGFVLRRLGFPKSALVGSMGERNTCFKFSRGRMKSQGLSWALIQT
jgi:hypothetical protein